MNTIKTYFDLTKGERNAAFFLLSVILFFTILPFFEQAPNSEKADFSDLLLLAKLDSMENAQENKSNNIEFYNIKLIPFDPNSASIKTLIEIGLNKYTAERIDRYRSAGGKFKVKSDLFKVYGIDSAKVVKLWSCIQLPEKSKTTWEKEALNNQNYKTNKAQEILDINSADTTQLISLPMIGSKLANRIILYRNKLGGFYSCLQLLEVYGLKPETFETIKSRIQVNVDLIEKIDINNCSADQLNKHPYFGYKISSQLINYRAQHGAYKSLIDLKNVVSISQESIEKMKFYIKFL